MTKKEFINELRTMADELEKGSYHIINLSAGYIFGNRNYGEVHVPIAEGINVNVTLFSATDEERKECVHEDV